MAMSQVLSLPIVVVGGGIMGLWVAEHLLSLQKRPVLVVEQANAGAGASGRGAGGLAVHQGTRLDAALAGESLRAYRELGDGIESPLTRRVGRLTICGSQHSESWAEQMLTNIAASGYTAEILDPEEIRSVVPGVNTEGLSFGIWSTPDSFLDIPKAISVLRERITRGHGSLLENARVASIITVGDEVAGVQLDNGEVLESDTVVVAAGTVSKSLLSTVGFQAHMKSFRTQAVVVGTEPGVMWPALRDFTAQYYAIPQTPASLLVGGGNYALADDGDPCVSIPVTKSFSDDILAQFSERFPYCTDGIAINSWTGVVHTTPDDQPLFGATDQVQGLWVASGLAGRGVGRAPALGRALAMMIVGEDPIHDFRSFSPDRFRDIDDFELDVIRRVP